MLNVFGIPGSMITSQLNPAQSIMQSQYGEMKDSAIEFDNTLTKGKEEQTERDRSNFFETYPDFCYLKSQISELKA